MDLSPFAQPVEHVNNLFVNLTNSMNTDPSFS